MMGRRPKISERGAKRRGPIPKPEGGGKQEKGRSAGRTKEREKSFEQRLTEDEDSDRKMDYINARVKLCSAVE